MLTGECAGLIDQPAEQVRRNTKLRNALGVQRFEMTYGFRERLRSVVYGRQQMIVNVSERSLQLQSLSRTSRTLRASASGVKGFSRKLPIPL